MNLQDWVMKDLDLQINGSLLYVVAFDISEDIQNVWHIDIYNFKVNQFPYAQAGFLCKL